MEQEYSLGLMETNMMEIGKMTRGMEKEYTLWLMETNMMDIGKIIRRMEKEYTMLMEKDISIMVVKRKKNKFGRMVLNNDSLNILHIFHIFINIF